MTALIALGVYCVALALFLAVLWRRIGDDDERRDELERRKRNW